MSLALFYFAISAALAFVVSIGVAAAPKGQRAELATWGGVIAALWFFFLLALVADELITRFMRLVRRVKSR